ncbi:MAG: FMN-binding protein [Candidatus Omnitrophica bacterium]|nr:FMN-binding protein [Candidatus Omnitrophota bacterium]
MKEKIKILIFVLFLGSISGSLLLGVDKYTKFRIVKNQEFKIKAAVLDVFGLLYDKKSLEGVFKENIEMIKSDGFIFYKSKNGEFAFEFSGSGLWGPISGIIALEKDLKTIKGIKIIHQEETPGLGGRIAEAEFLSRFQGKEILPVIKIVPEGKAKEKNEVDAITGATGTSRAFEKLLNENIQKKLKILSTNEKE